MNIKIIDEKPLFDSFLFLFFSFVWLLRNKLPQHQRKPEICSLYYSFNILASGSLMSFLSNFLLQSFDRITMTYTSRKHYIKSSILSNRLKEIKRTSRPPAAKRITRLLLH